MITNHDGSDYEPDYGYEMQIGEFAPREEWLASLVKHGYVAAAMAGFDSHDFHSHSLAK